MFEVGEFAILNQNIEKGLPGKSGEVVEIVKKIKSPNYDYEVDLGNSINPVKETELAHLSEMEKDLIKYIKKGNKVIYRKTDEIVNITKVDFIHYQVEIEFEDKGHLVTDFSNIFPLKEESDSLEVLGEKSRIETHRDVIEEIHNTFKIKNADYGNSFGEQYEEYGLLSAVIRLDDKIRRLKQLMKQDAQVKDESIRDTLLDLANYGIMTVMELDNK